MAESCVCSGRADIPEGVGTVLTSDRRDRMPLPSVAGRAVRVEDLYREHYLDLVRFAVQFVDDRGIAEDVVQDVFAALKAHRRHLDDPLRYLRVAVLNRSRSVLRRRRIERRFVLVRERYAEAADEASLRSDEQSRVLAAVSRLPRRQREVVVLRYYEDLEIGEVAILLGITSGAVSSSLTRAMDRLIELLGSRNG